MIQMFNVNLFINVYSFIRMFVHMHARILTCISHFIAYVQHAT